MINPQKFNVSFRFLYGQAQADAQHRDIFIHQITKSLNHQIIKSPNHQITKSPNHQITKYFRITVDGRLFAVHAESMPSPYTGHRFSYPPPR